MRNLRAMTETSSKEFCKKIELQNKLAMYKLQNALVLVVALSAVALVATAAVRFVSPTKTPKKAARGNSKRRPSADNKRQESQVLRWLKDAEAVYLPLPVFLCNDSVNCLKKTLISEVPIYVPQPTFQHTQRYSLPPTNAEQKCECYINPRTSGLMQQPHQDNLSEVSATQSCNGSVDGLYSLDQHDVAEFLKIHTLRTTSGPSQIRQIPYAASFITPTPLRSTTSKAAMKEITIKKVIQVHQNLETVQPQGVSYSLDKHEVCASGPNQIRQIAYAFVDVQQKAVSTEVVVIKAAAPKSAPQEEWFTLSRHESETTRPIISGPFGIRQIPFVVTEKSIVAPETKMAKPVSVPSTLDTSATHQSESGAEPLYSLDWNDTQNAWKYVLSSTESSKLHPETVGTGVKEDVVPAAVPHQAAGVSSTLFSLDEHELQNVWKIAPLYSMTMCCQKTLPHLLLPYQP
ncbi:hypothetical protein BJ741DRAFT_384637 [Chytriomyces cf. hyalinus JEL632]|nr:hypothetical protein BJ741DRAFT_384637 [Chytriomyces cf. hyalinus JEL632]